ncbi:MAG: TetR/AcrR family transcriptional regulator [Chloroflexota bacterium]
MSPRPDVSETRKNQILDAAAIVFARQGFYQARMDDIVTESGLSKGALYWYFKSKDDIITALLRRIFDEELIKLQSTQQTTGSVIERILGLSRHVAADFTEIARLVPITFEFYAVASRQETVRIFLKEYLVAYRTILQTIIQQGIDRQELRPVNAEDTATTIVAIYEGLLLLWVIDAEHIDWHTQPERSIRLLFDGLRKSP